MSDAKTVLQEVQAVFLAKISEKNSWGKNEILEVWRQCLIQVLMEKLNA